MKKVFKIFLALILIFLFIGEYKVIYRINSTERVAKYIGIVWVGLDHYTIYKYDSDDKPKVIFKYTKTVNED